MTPDFRRALFKQMLRIRTIELEIASRYRDQEMRTPVHLSIGQEAAAVGACAALEKEDYAFGTHRSHGHYLAKGGDLTAMLAELYGRSGGCCQGKGGSMHLVDLSVGFMGATSIVASTLPIAAGAAFASHLRNERRVTAVFLGEAAVEEGVFHESLNFAALHKLPLVYFCENNFYSVYSNMSVRQPANREVCELAKGHGVLSLQGDGNNVEDVYKLCKQAVDVARERKGPVFVELKTYRWREHCGPNYDNDIGYRTESEFLEWRARCPVEDLQTRLLHENVLNADALKQMQDACDAEVRSAFDAAKASPWPAPDQLMTHVYAGE